MKKVDFTDQFYLKLQLKPPHFSRSYGVLYTFTEGDKTHTIKYNLDVTYVKTIIDRARIFKLERTTPVYVNDIEPDLLVDELAYECGKIFYPLMIEVDFDGKFLSVLNHSEITTRWKEKKIAVSEYFKGELTEKYIQLMDSAIATPEQVTEIFANDLFISVYFSSVYKSYTSQYAIKRNTTFPILGQAAAVLFEVAETIDQDLNEADKIEIIHQGTIIDERSNRDLKEESSYPLSKYAYEGEIGATGNYYALYRLDAETKAIFSIVADYVLDTEPTQKTQVKVFELIEKVVEKEDVKQENNGPAEMFIIDGRHEKKESKLGGIFNFLLGK
ncbi:hypothetical protein SAMN06265348_102293 [Pedobacter westerhofensis]|uniref:Uncharacterized protein n=1 Tax=Pedobacter westerhofensis TaxID=425512 RepID=A0A521BH03_9SPHI|nr:hypothetical protein [Pedobacter westerhofensis]SMO46375.1 hypothetical protein SAMN06265348_102293 [Pedobacter westerhofensis]